MTRPTFSFAEALDHARGGTAVLTFTDNQWILVYAPNAIVKRKRWAIECGMAGDPFPLQSMQFDERSSVERHLACMGVNLQNGWRV